MPVSLTLSHMMKAYLDSVPFNHRVLIAAVHFWSTSSALVSLYFSNYAIVQSFSAMVKF